MGFSTCSVAYEYGLCQEFLELFQKLIIDILNNYFKPGCRKTNAATEGLNTLIRNVNSLGNGYSFRNLRAKCLYISLVHERIHYGIDLDIVIREYKEHINS